MFVMEKDMYLYINTCLGMGHGVRNHPNISAEAGKEVMAGALAVRRADPAPPSYTGENTPRLSTSFAPPVVMCLHRLNCPLYRPLRLGLFTVLPIVSLKSVSVSVLSVRFDLPPFDVFYLFDCFVFSESCQTGQSRTAGAVVGRGEENQGHSTPNFVLPCSGDSLWRCWLRPGR